MSRACGSTSLGAKSALYEMIPTYCYVDLSLPIDLTKVPPSPLPSFRCLKLGEECPLRNFVNIARINYQGTKYVCNNAMHSLELF
ncbi:hypothetical protein J6590_047519 [Homalodisca vitripennis]|nr:hypothetical protein J6590_047519 [Homalodisca vitripennis]